MVVIAHRLSTLRRADNIVVIEQGQIVETGTWESLSQQEGGRFWSLLSQQCSDQQVFPGKRGWPATRAKGSGLLGLGFQGGRRKKT